MSAFYSIAKFRMDIVVVYAWSTAFCIKWCKVSHWVSKKNIFSKSFCSVRTQKCCNRATSLNFGAFRAYSYVVATKVASAQLWSLPSWVDERVPSSELYPAEWMKERPALNSTQLSGRKSAQLWSQPSWVEERAPSSEVYPAEWKKQCVLYNHLIMF